jgi:hypothetical protein
MQNKRLKNKNRSIYRKIKKMNYEINELNQKIKFKNEAIPKPNINVSVLEASMINNNLETAKNNNNKSRISASLNLTDKLNRFSKIYTQISNKYEEASRIVNFRDSSNKKNNQNDNTNINNICENISHYEDKLSPLPSNRNSNFDILNKSCSNLIVDCHSINHPVTTLTPVKEINFKLSHYKNKSANEFTNFKIEKININLQSTSHKFESKNYEDNLVVRNKYPEEVKNLYNKYFKFGEKSFVKEEYNSYPRKASMNSINSSGMKNMSIAKFTDKKLDEKIKLMNYLNTSIYLKSLVNKSSWVKKKD